jgi:hypothetical protein
MRLLSSCSASRPRAAGALVLSLASLVGAFNALTPTTSSAALLTFGSPLSQPATLNTSENLEYVGTYTNVPPSPEVPTGVVHTPHWGADTALWNSQLASGSAGSPATGQAVKVLIEGCAMRAPGGPPPLRQIHLQDLSPLAGGGVQVNLTSQPFNLPVCGQGGATTSTVTTYEPINLCVGEGDYVALNDEGGFVEHFYRSGVPYQVIGPSAGSTLDSFIRGNGTGDGATLNASDRSANDGFAATPNEELMLQVVLGTGAEATHVCAGGTAGAPRALAPMRISPQTDGVNRSRYVAVAIYCRPTSGCPGEATLVAALSGHVATLGGAHFYLRGNKTGRVRIRVSDQVVKLLRSHAAGLPATLTARFAGRTFSQTIGLRIF